MVIIKLMGGLGNQMFQYAAAKALAEKHKVPLKVDLTFLRDRVPKENFTFRDYELDCFSNYIEVANDEDLSKFKSASKLKRVFRILVPNYSTLNYNEPSFNFDKAFFNLPTNVYLEGYWQTEKYFLHIRSLIIKEFRFILLIDEINLSIISSIKSGNSVSIHIRRGDFVDNKIINSVHGACSLNYYNKAINFMNEHIENPTFYIFSDDVGWARQQFDGLSSVFFIDHNKGKNSYLDMQLMSTCKHNIIANSSFSWWGAWLNNNKDKIVTAPNVWFADTSINNSDIIPEDWIKI